MADGEFWSIGEVLSLLQDEFPEITISKIRFLESQGLIEPERTPSGYRRFFQNDFDLLQWILVQQRDHYLPLKVIRDRIRSGDTEQGLLDFSGSNGQGEVQPANSEPGGSSVAEPTAADNGLEPSSSGKPVAQPTSGVPPASDSAAVAGAMPAETTPADAVTSESTAERSTATDHDAVDRGPSSGMEADEALGEETLADESSVHPRVIEPVTPIALTRDELAESSGCSIKMIGELERYGLVKGRKAGPTVLYDNTALLIARISGQFGAFGLEPRHLRTFLIGAEREMGLVHQVVEPMLHRRDEETRRKAHETLDDLTDLAGSLRSILMRQAAEELLPKH